jgi:hypothetical protein
VLLGQHAAPGLAEHVVAVADAEVADEVVQFAREQDDGVEVGTPVREVGGLPLPVWS